MPPLLIGDASDAVQITTAIAGIAAVFISAVSAGFLAWLAYKTAQLNSSVKAAAAVAETQGRRAAVRVEEVAGAAREVATRVSRVAEAAEVVAGKVDDVRANLDETKIEHTKHEAVAVETNRRLGDIEVVSQKTHALVNSAMGAQLKLAAVLSRRLANLTGQAADLEAATAAEALLDQHQGKQTIIDAKEEETKS